MNIIDRLLLNEGDKERLLIANELAQMGTKGVDMILDALKSSRDLRVLLITLSRLITKEKNKKRLISYYSRIAYRPLIEYSMSDDAKIRKNTYIIMGELQDDILLSPLLEALEKETTYFNIPSILLALGNLGSGDIINRIANRVQEILQLDISDKHKKEIIKARDKCIDKLGANKERHSFVGFNRNTRVLLTTMQGKERVMLEEAKKYYPQAKIIDSGVEIVTDDYSKIKNIRTYYDCFIAPIELDNIPLQIKIIEIKLKEFLSYQVINSMHKGAGQYRYRIEIGSLDKRIQLIDELIYAINRAYDEKLINSVSNYELEFRVIINGDKCSIYLKLFTMEDKRFSYRINDIPASIRGENAAMIMRLVRYHLKEGASVLDPFVGTGTMLIERQLIGNTSLLTGVDVSKDAIEKARVNLNSANVKASLINKDITRLSSDARYDEIISNMPYGLRVGTHQRNEKLYSSFVDKIPALLKSDGKAILLTADYKLLKKAAERKLRLIDEYVINNGGLYPRLLIYKLI